MGCGQVGAEDADERLRGGSAARAGCRGTGEREQDDGGILLREETGSEISFKSIESCESSNTEEVRLTPLLIDCFV